MSEPIRFRDIRLEGGCIIIRPEREDLGKAMALMKGIKKKLYVLSVKEHRNKRSLDANQKMWALINEMSTMIKLTPEEIYQGYIPDVGNNYRVFPVKPEDINEFAADWCNGHIGRMVEDMGPCRKRDLIGYHNLRCYKGSSEYDTQTFSRLLELVMQDCRQLGIETMSERERSLLMEEWEATYADRHQGTVYTKGGQNPGS
jgi:hypothetical protein